MATVDFSMQEWTDFAANAIGRGSVQDDLKTVRRLYNQMEKVGAGRALNELLDRLNEFLDGSGVEALFERDGRIVTDAWDSRHLIEYINFGDTYVETLIYDVFRHAFYLGSYGGFIEAWEAENPQTAQYVDCGQDFPLEELDEGERCRDCRTTPISTWRPERWGNPPLIAVLRSVEGNEVAVHFWDDKPTGVAFSAVMGDGSFSARQIQGRRSDEPYIYVWTDLVNAFRNKDSMSVAYVDRDVTIRREEFDKLLVAMDSFIEGGGVQLNPDFLKPGPVLWTCDQINYIVWYEERGEAAVEAFVAEFDSRGRVQNDISVWSAHSPEVEQLVEDGFIKWNDDASVRAYLRDQGVCRSA